MTPAPPSLAGSFRQRGSWSICRYELLRPGGSLGAHRAVALDEAAIGMQDSRCRFRFVSPEYPRERLENDSAMAAGWHLFGGIP